MPPELYAFTCHPLCSKPFPAAAPTPTPPGLLPAQRCWLLRQTLWGASSRLLPAFRPVPTALPVPCPHMHLPTYTPAGHAVYA